MDVEIDFVLSNFCLVGEEGRVAASEVDYWKVLPSCGHLFKTFSRLIYKFRDFIYNFRNPLHPLGVDVAETFYGRRSSVARHNN